MKYKKTILIGLPLLILGLLVAGYLFITNGDFTSKDPAVIEQAFEPLVVDHGKRAVLVLHGFGGSPAEVRPLAQHLADQGLSIHLQTLSGHGESIEAFRATTNQALIQQVSQQYKKLAASYDKVYVVGFSMGGLLAIHLASTYPIEGLILVNTPQQILISNSSIKTWARLTRYASYLIRTIPKMGIVDIRKKGPHSLVLYNAYPIESVERLFELIQQSQKRAQEVSCPVLIVQSMKDRAVMSQSAENWQNLFTQAPEKNVLHAPQSGHHVFWD